VYTPSPPLSIGTGLKYMLLIALVINILPLNTSGTVPRISVNVVVSELYSGFDKL
jgi:hypothetical protein